MYRRKATEVRGYEIRDEEGLKVGPDNRRDCGCQAGSEVRGDEGRPTGESDATHATTKSTGRQCLAINIFVNLTTLRTPKDVLAPLARMSSTSSCHLGLKYSPKHPCAEFADLPAHPKGPVQASRTLPADLKKHISSRPLASNDEGRIRASNAPTCKNHHILRQ